MSNLDEILKKEMETFSPDAPNVWAGVKGTMSHTNAGFLSKISSKLGLSKSLLISAPIALITATTIIVGVVIYSKSSKDGQIIEPVKQEKQKPFSKKEEIIINDGAENQKIAKVIAQTKNPKVQKKIIEVTSKSVEKEEKSFVVSKSDNVVPVEDKSEPNKMVTKIHNSTENAIPTNDEKTEKHNPSHNLDVDIGFPLSTDTSEREKLVSFKIPGSFSPNDDGSNDFFVVLIEEHEFYSMKIFNEKNEIIFESFDKDNCWDGKNKITGVYYPAGVYYYEFVCKGRNASKKQTRIGKFSLFR